MSWANDLNAIRQWMIDVLLDLYPDLLITTEPLPTAMSGPVARIRQIDLEFHPETPLGDRLTARFELVLRFSDPPRPLAEHLTEQAALIRDALTEQPQAAGLGSNARVERVTIEQTEGTSAQAELSIHFACELVAFRGGVV